MTTRARKSWGAGALVALAAAFLALTVVATFALRVVSSLFAEEAG